MQKLMIAVVCSFAYEFYAMENLNNHENDQTESHGVLPTADSSEVFPCDSVDNLIFDRALDTPRNDADTDTTEQKKLADIEITERRNLVTRQNLEYQECLRIDQENALKKARREYTSTQNDRTEVHAESHPTKEELRALRIKQFSKKS